MGNVGARALVPHNALPRMHTPLQKKKKKSTTLCVQGNASRGECTPGFEGTCPKIPKCIILKAIPMHKDCVHQSIMT
jgi:hypothetical protein